MVFKRAQHGQKQTLRSSQCLAVVRARIEPRVTLGMLFVTLVAFCVSPEAGAVDPDVAQPQQITPPSSGTAPRPQSQGGQTTGTFNVQSPGTGMAASGKSGVAQVFDWTNRNQYSECGQDCLYQKGNENISLQALYQVNKINNIQNILNDTKFTQDDYLAIMPEMAPYCPDVDTHKDFDSDKSYDDANKCYQRYLQVQIPILRKMKAAIVHNDDSAGQLQSDQKFIVQGGAPGGAANQKVSVFATPQDGKPKKPQTPEFQTEDELMSTTAGQQKLQLLASESYAKWATEQMANSAPKEDDYVLTVDVPRDPKDPRSEMITRILRNSDGTPKKDKKAFLAAKAAYEAQLKGTPTDESILEMAKDPKYANPKLTMGVLDPDIKANAVAKKVAREHLLDRISYEQARNQAVAATTDLLRKQGVLGGGASGGSKGGIAGAGAAAAKSKAAKKIDPASEFGAFNVLKTPVGPGIDKKGNLVQPAVQPNAKANGDYTVSFKPAELGKTTDDMQKNLDEIKADEEAISAGKTPPSALNAQTGAGAAGTSGSAASGQTGKSGQTGQAGQTGHSGTSDGSGDGSGTSGSGVDRTTAGVQNAGDSKSGADSKPDTITMPKYINPEDEQKPDYTSVSP